MKHTLLLICAGALVTAAGCSSDKEEDFKLSKSSIAFTASVPYAQNERSVITTQNINEFTVYGYVGDELYMNAMQVTKQGNNWVYSPTYYWPVDQTVDFYSYSPASAAGMGTLLTANNDFRIDNYTNDGNTDFIYAVNKNEKASETTGTTSRQVQVNFRHAMSKIAVMFSKRSNTGNFKFFVRNVSVVNAYNQGNFIFPNSTTSSDELNSDNVGSWEGQTALTSELLNNTIIGPVNDASGAVAANSTGYMFVIPQSIRPYESDVPNSAGMYFDVECQFQSADSDHVIWPNAAITEQTEDQYAHIRIPIRNKNGAEWELGHSYVYTISLDVPAEGSTKISFDVTVDNYQDYGNTTLD